MSTHLPWWGWVIFFVLMEIGAFAHPLRWRHREGWKEHVKSEFLWSQVFIAGGIIYLIIDSCA